MPSAYVGLGIAKGASAAQDYERGRPERDLRRQTAKLQQKQATQELDEYIEGAPTRKSASELELEQLKSSTRQMQSKGLQQSTYQAFRMYETDGSTRHLNQFLQSAKTNPVGQSMWGQWSRFDPVVRNQETEAMLGRHGITDIDDFFSDAELVKSKVMATDQTGKQVMLDMNKVYQGTGFTAHMTQEELKTQQQRAQIENLMRGQQSAETNIIGRIAEEDNLSTYEAAQAYYGIKNAGGKLGSKIERVAQQLREDNENLSYVESLRMATKTVETRTASQKDLEQAETSREALDEAAGGDFFTADLSDPAIRRKVGPLITEIEKLTDKELTTEDKRVARTLRSLTSLGAEAGEEITDEQAGIADKLWRGLKSYVTNNIEGTEGVAAYETFRNTLIKSMSGATVTPTEEKALNRALGTLGQQTGPVLSKLMTQMKDVKTQLQSIIQMNDEHVAQYYLGSSLEDIDIALEAIDERVEYFRSYGEREKIVDEMKVSPIPLTPPGERRSLDSIFDEAI